MRALPAPAPPRPRVRQAAAVRTDAPPARQVLARGQARSQLTEREYELLLRTWQSVARVLADIDPSLRYVTSIVPETIARCDVFVEQRLPNGEWERSSDPRLVDIPHLYRNPIEDTTELIRSHAHHEQVEGELIQTVRDTPQGVEWGVWSRGSVEVGKPTPDDITVRLIPGGKIDDGTAWAIPRAQATQIWVPHRVWKGYATSPLVAAIGATTTRRSLDHYLSTAAASNARMNGALWAADDHWTEPTAEAELDPESNDVGVPKQTAEDAYYQLAQMRWADSTDITAVAPAFWHWSKEDGPPQWIKIGEPFDPQLKSLREELLKEVGRAFFVPLDWLLGGGVNTDSNHWSAWYIGDSYFEQAVAPYANRLFHDDLTKTFLRRLLAGDGNYNPDDYRMGYDPTPVIVKADKTDVVIKVFPMGLLSIEAALKYLGFEPQDAMPDHERQWLLDILARGRELAPGAATAPGLPVAPGTVQQVPPAQPTALPPPAAQGYVGAVDGAPTPARAARVARAAIRRRSTTGAQIYRAASMAYEEALTRAGAKVQSRITNRGTSASVKARALAAIAERGPYGPILASVGLTESALLAGAFTTLEPTVAEMLTRWRERDRAALDAAGFAPDQFAPLDTSRIQTAAEYVTATALATARQALLRGVEPALTVDGAPAWPGKPVTAAPRPPGPLTATLRVPTSVARNALRISEGQADVAFGTTADELPDVFAATTTTGATSVEDALARYAANESALAQAIEEGRAAPTEDQAIEYLWVHGFFGDPVTPFEPHEDLGAVEFTTTDTTNDPDLATQAPFDWVGDFYQPDDHDGCTCDWVPALPWG